MKHHYQKLTEILRKKILKGGLAPGDILPSENELCEQYNLARSTVRQALDELVKAGYVVKQKGKGTVVIEPKRQRLGLFSIKGFSAVLGEAAVETSTVFLDKPHRVTLDDTFFYNLSAAEKAKGAICLKRLRLADKSPVMLEYTYVPDTRLPLHRKEDFIEGSLFVTLKRKFGIDIVRADQELIAAEATKEIAKVFDIRIGAPVLHVYRKYHTSRKGFYIYSSFFCHTMKYSIGNTLY